MSTLSESAACALCGAALVPGKMKFCSTRCARRYWKLAHPREKKGQRPKICPACGAEFVKPRAKFCSDRCRYRHKDQVSKANAAHRLVDRIAAIRRYDARTKRTPRRRAAHVAAPAFGPVLPFAVLELAIEPAPDFCGWPRGAQVFHGLASAILAKPHRREDEAAERSNAGDFHLKIGAAGTLLLVVYDANLAASLPARSGRYQLAERRVNVAIAAPYRIGSAAIARGMQEIELVAETPMYFRNNGSGQQTPGAANLSSMLARGVTQRLGLPQIPPEMVPVEILRRDSETRRVYLGERFGCRHGWVGRMTVRTNAMGAGLLMAAEWVGLGAGVAYGFGAIRIKNS